MVKKKTNLLLILLAFTLTLTPISPLAENLFPAVKATYVEGEISTDTVWTLLDSPFIVSQNVTIRNGVTLTIEPGVEVRFGGGPFTIIVDGTLVAKGTREKPVKFTSNREKPQTGDWATILFNGRGQQPSILENCVVEYGINGVTVNGSVVIVKKSTVQFNLQNGIMVLDGTVFVEQSVIQHNKGGITIKGGNAVIQENKVMFNVDGIILTSDLSMSHVNITRNHISSNKNSGVSLTVENSGSGISIRENNVSSNFYGLYISTADASTFITRNYIYNNTVGAFYNQGNHTIRFNDIYGNVLGIDASPDARVNATQNYWGHRSGPYHESLNPHGKGNPVGGNGVNIDFIFFLTASIKYKNSPPTAVLWTDKKVVALGQEVTFVGINSHDDGRVDKYFFDFGDGRKSNWTTLSIFFHKYNSVGMYNASLQVVDDFGNISDVVSTTVQVVENLPQLEVSLSLNNYTVDCNTPVIAHVNVSLNGAPVGSASVYLFAVGRGFLANVTGSTGSAGNCTIMFVAPNVTDVTNIRVIARASKEGCADGSNYTYVKVLPPLNVNVAVKSPIYSEETIAVTVNVADAYEEPVANVSLCVWINDQEIGRDVTDINGVALFNITAPRVYSPSSLTVYVEASKEMYAKGFAKCVIEVLPKVLSLTLHLEPQEIRMGESATVFANVYWNGKPVSDVNVSFTSDTSIILDQKFGLTDSNGVVTTTLTVNNSIIANLLRDIARSEGIPANLTLRYAVVAVAEKEGYVSVVNWTVVDVKPKVLVVSVAVDRYVVVTDEKVKVAVHVECEGIPVADANVTLSLNVSSFKPLTALTDSDGNATFAFNMVEIPRDMFLTLTVAAQKDGYVDGYGFLMLTAKPANLTVNVDVYPPVVKPGEFSTVYIKVECEGKPVVNASVEVAASIEGFTPLTLFTDENGYCVVQIYAPSTTGTLVVYVTVNVTKDGYNGVYLSDIYFQVVPETGFPWFTLLLVLIPVVLVVVFVVLVKLGVIVVSFGEGEEAG